jgi:hypothetical protein
VLLLLATAVAGGDRSIAQAEATAESGMMHDVTLFVRVPYQAEGRHLAVVTGNVYATSKSAARMRAASSRPTGRMNMLRDLDRRHGLRGRDQEVRVRRVGLFQPDGLDVPRKLLKILFQAAPIRNILTR